MITRTYTTSSKKGLTTKTLISLVNEANKFKCSLELHFSDESANMKILTNIMSLIILENSEFKIIADGEDEIDAIESIENYLKYNQLI